MKSFATRYFNLSGGSNGGMGGYSGSRRDVPPDGTPGTFRFIGEEEPEDVGEAESLLGNVAGRRLGQAGSKGRPLSQEVSFFLFHCLIQIKIRRSICPFQELRLLQLLLYEMCRPGQPNPLIRALSHSLYESLAVSL